MRITGVVARDIRFPTSESAAGSDAVHKDPDYSAATALLATDDPGGLAGHGMTFTVGRGNELCVAAIRSLEPFVAGLEVEAVRADMAGFWRALTSESQLRWVGPEKGVIHLAVAAVVNAVWDLIGRIERKPVWKLVADMTPEELVGCVDFRYLSDALTREEALEMLRRRGKGKAEREAELRKTGYPAYITSAGWIGYPDEKVRRLCREALAAGWEAFKMKVGVDRDADVRRAGLMREEIGPDRALMMDANQVWDVGEAIAWMQPLKAFNPLWIEEPTSPDDVAGHAAISRALAPVGVATGEHVHNRIMFKQYLASGAMQYCQIDACRLGGVSEALAVMLLAAKFGVPVCPHAGGVGLCEVQQHLSIADYVAVSGSLEGRRLEFADHLHEHFAHPLVIRDGRYMPPSAPGLSLAFKPASLDRFEFPGGEAWTR